MKKSNENANVPLLRRAKGCVKRKKLFSFDFYRVYIKLRLN